MRFHLDEQVDPDIARALRQYGIDVTTTIDVGLRTAKDEEQLDFARRARRVLVTHDTDFLRFAGVDLDHSGIADCHKTARSLGEIIRSLILIYEILSLEEISGRVEYL
jgi:uncharacterized protein with PIN domain